MEDEFYVLVDLDNHEFLQENGGTTQYILQAEHFINKNDVLEELKVLDDDIDFVCYKVKASYWLERELLGDEK